MNDLQKDRLIGSMIGYAVGDALGLGTEFMTASEAARRYPGGLRDYSQIIRDAHRSWWERGDWTNDTEIMMRLTDDIVTNGGINLSSAARRLVEWYGEDSSEMPQCMRWCCRDPRYTDDPHSVCEQVWDQMGHPEPRNEALGRALFGAMMGDGADDTTLALVHLTHWGPVCDCTALVTGRVAYDLLWNGEMTPLVELERICHREDRGTLESLRLAHDGTLEQLELDDPEQLWHARKTMMAALWPLWHCKSFGETLDSIIMAAGDADTNGAMALALAGMRYGSSAIPQHLVDGLLRRDELLDMGRRWCDFLEQRTKN